MSDLIERLRKLSLGCSDEDTMRIWDGIRKALMDGNYSSGPRDRFESIIDNFAEVCSEAAAALEALTVERDAMMDRAIFAEALLAERDEALEAVRPLLGSMKPARAEPAK